MESEFKVGDEVAYSSKFLRSIVDYSKDSADKRFIIRDLVDFDDKASLPSYAQVQNKITKEILMVNLKTVVNVKDLAFEASL